MYFDIWPPDDYMGTALGELTDASDKQTRDEDQSIGSGQFVINRHSSQAVWCESRALVRVRRVAGGPFAANDSRYVFGFFIEDSQDVTVSEDEEGGENLTRGGRGMASYLQRALIYPNENISGHASYWATVPTTGEVVFPDKTIGEAFRILILNAQERAGVSGSPGVLDDLTIDFTISNDSAGTPWPDVETEWKFPVGMNLLDVLSKVVAGQTYFRMTPGFLLSCYVAHPGADLSGAITFAKAIDITEAAEKRIEAQGLITRALVKGTRKDNRIVYHQSFTGADTLALEPAYGRIEGYAEYNATPFTSRLEKVGLQAIHRSRLQSSGPTTAGVLETAGKVPYDDYETGDTVTVNIPGEYDHSEVQVNAIILTEDEAGQDLVALEFEDSPFDQLSGPGGFGSATATDGPPRGCSDCPELPPFVPDVSGSAAAHAKLYGPNNRPDRASYPWIVYYGDGDTPPVGYASAPKTSNIEYVDRTTNGLTSRWGLRALADMTVDIKLTASMAEVLRPGSWSTTFRILVDGAVIYSLVTPHTVSFLTYMADSVDHTVSGVAVPAGAVVTSQAFWSYGGVPVLVPAGTDAGELSINGTAGATVAANRPVDGQMVGEEVVVVDGDTTYATNYAYEPNGLHVYANGVRITVDQTDPAAGTFALASELPAGTRLFLWYQASSPTYLGTGNNPSPGAVNGIVPYPLLGADGDGSGDHVLHDDGRWHDAGATDSGGSDCCGADDPIDRATLRTEVLVGGTPGIVQSATESDAIASTITVDAGNGWVTPTTGHILVAWHSVRSGTAHTPLTPSGWSAHPSGTVDYDGYRSAMYYKTSDGTESSIAFSLSAGDQHAVTVVELDGSLVLDDDAEATGTGTSANAGTVTPTGGSPTIIIGGFSSKTSDVSSSVTPGAGWTEIVDQNVQPSVSPVHWMAYQIVPSASGSYTPSGTVSNSGTWGGQSLAFIDSSTPTWVDAPEASDGDDTTYETASVTEDDAFIRADLGESLRIGDSRLLIGFASSGSKTLELYGALEDDFSDEVLLATETFTATGSYTADEIATDLSLPDPYRYYRWKDAGANLRRVYTWELLDATLGDLHEHSLDSLSDVNVPSPSDGDLLTWDAGGSEWVAAAPTVVASLNDLSDVTITSAATGDRLRFDGSQWVDSTLTWEPLVDGGGTVLLDGSGNILRHEVAY